MSGLFNETEHQLIVELASATASHLAQLLQDTSDPLGQGHYWHMFDSSFTTPCELLWRLGVAHGLAPDGARIAYPNHSFPAVFKFADDATLRTALQDAGRLPLIDLDDLLGTWLNLSHRFPLNRKPALPVSRRAFDVSFHLRPVMTALVQSGHARDIGGRLEWTARISAAMERVHLWEPDGTPIGELIDAMVELAAGEMLSLADEGLRQTLASKARATGELEFVTWLRDDMDGLFIDFRPDGAVSPHRGAERIRMLKRIHARLHSKTH